MNPWWDSSRPQCTFVSSAEVRETSPEGLRQLEIEVGFGPGQHMETSTMSRSRRNVRSIRTATLAALAFAAIGAAGARADITAPTGNNTIDTSTYNFRTDDVGMASWMTSTGWNINQIVVSYNWKTDTLNFDVKVTGIAGDADGNGDPGKADPRTIAAGGVDTAHLGGRKSFTIAFESVNAQGHPGNPLAIAGVPEYKNQFTSTAGLDGFRLAQYVPGSHGLSVSYGGPLSGGATGTLLYDPSAAHPDFEFQIKGFSKIPGVNLENGFFFSAFAGSPDDIVAGEKNIGWTKVAGFTPVPQLAPEPGSVVLLGLGGLGLWLGRRTGAARRSRSA
jgi:hypothetical protein